MNSNIKIFIFILVAIMALYFSKGKYGQYSKNKSIQACTIVQKNKFKDKPIKEIKDYCEQEINKNINRSLHEKKKKKEKKLFIWKSVNLEPQLQKNQKNT